MSESTAIQIRPLDAAEAESRIEELAAILVDAVASGASVNFLAGFDMDGARRFWRGQMPGFASGERLLLVAEDRTGLVGTAIVTFAQQPNQPHRAEIGKMLVLSSLRRQGLGRRLLTAAEEAARAAGRTLLMLDTEAGSAGDLLYRRFGWIEIGTVPGHALRPNGVLAPTTMFYKTLA